MQHARHQDAQFTQEEENEFQKMEKLLKRKKQMKEKRAVICNAMEKNADIEHKK